MEYILWIPWEQDWKPPRYRSASIMFSNPSSFYLLPFSRFTNTCKECLNVTTVTGEINFLNNINSEWNESMLMKTIKIVECKSCSLKMWYIKEANELFTFTASREWYLYRSVGYLVKILYKGLYSSVVRVQMIFDQWVMWWI